MRISWIEPAHLAASDAPISEADMRSLHTQGIRAILTLTEHPLTRMRAITPALLAELDITVLHVPVPDQEPPTRLGARDILRHIATMHTQRRPLLVHCAAGVGRTGTALHLYYLARGLTLDEARAAVRARRPACMLLSPAQHAFLRQLFAKD